MTVDKRKIQTTPRHGAPEVGGAGMLPGRGPGNGKTGMQVRPNSMEAGSANRKGKTMKPADESDD